MTASRARASRIGLLTLGLSALPACLIYGPSLLGFDQLGVDASTDGSVLEVGSDARDASDAGDAGATVYSALNDTAKWSTFDTMTVNAGAKGFAGVAFDGRYVYFVPYGTGMTDGIVARYDTQAVFTTGGSWSTFDTATVNAGATGFAGAAFDGRYVYFSPYYNGGTDGIVARYDTQAVFTKGTSWATFDTATVNAGARGFQGTAFDGRFLYFVPLANSAADGIVTRYNTLEGSSAFTMASSWSTFDTSTVNVGAKGFQGAAFDGRYLYFVPYANDGCNCLVTRYDTMASFAWGASWSTFDLSLVNAGARGFAGAAFDGRYIYLVPNNNNIGLGIDGIVARYDTLAAFTSGGSWSTFDMTVVNAGAKGFQGAAFDGRYVYFVPFDNGVYDGLVPRYDTQAPFTAASSWSAFDVTTVNPGANGFQGAAFDGRYLYFVPDNNGIVARFDAKTPSSLPVGYAHGSFF